MSVIAVTGLAIEARIAAGAGVRTVVGGNQAQQLSVALEREMARGASAIISFGVAGGLDDGLAPGTWLIARKIVTATASWHVDAAWARAMRRRLDGAVHADVAGVDVVVDKLAAKQALRRTTGAAAVDTESHLVARLAAAHGLPFAAFRVIADPARRSLPAAALVALRADGTINRAAVLQSIRRTPRQLASLARTAIDTQIALRALSRGRRCLGPNLGFADFDDLLLDVP